MLVCWSDIASLDVETETCLGTLSLNVEPFPISLSTVIEPFIISMSCLVMLRPRPVPPNFAVVSPSAWVNSANTLSSCSGDIPIPVSDTSKLSQSSPLTTTPWAFNDTVPFSLNLHALLIKFSRHWRSLVSSLRITPMSGVTLITNALLFLAARGSPTLLRTVMTLSISNSDMKSSSFPASIFDKSNMSLISPSRCLPESLIFFRSSSISLRPSSSASSANSSL